MYCVMNRERIEITEILHFNNVFLQLKFDAKLLKVIVSL